ncbi:hypothetical protein VNO78_03942 [Psophocarpus tetragonolobus]|uniref:Uncharacterized protein n=1 Tax=Psophocarpus tetragonolobus TaxID=3891 RepID=A0AAN9T2B8_PSOTE
MGCLAGFLRKLQDIYTEHKVTSTIFFCLLVIPPSFFYTLYSTSHLSNVFLTLTNNEDANNFVGASFHYITFITQVEGFAVLGISVLCLLIVLLNIIGSQQKIDPEAELSIKSLISIITKPARSFLVTWFFVRLLKLGYIFLGILLVFHQHMTFVDSICHRQPELSALPTLGTIIFVAGGVLMFAYLASFGNLATEISIREGISGTKALEKASQLLEGKRKVIGFLVNLVLGVVSVGLFLGFVYLNTCSKISVDSNKSIMSNLWSYGISQVEFYTWISFSILYSRCKISLGETTIQPQGSFKRILLDQDI